MHIKQDLTKSISVMGTVISAQSYSVNAELTEVEVKSVRVKVGDRVKKGEVLAILDTSSLENSLQLAQANLDLQKKKNSVEVEIANRAYEAAQTTAGIQSDRNAQELMQAQGTYDSSMAKAQTADNSYNGAVSSRSSQEQNVQAAQKDADQAKQNAREKEQGVSAAQNALTSANAEVTAKENTLAELQKESAGASDVACLLEVHQTKYWQEHTTDLQQTVPTWKGLDNRLSLFLCVYNRKNGTENGKSGKYPKK